MKYEDIFKIYPHKEDKLLNPEKQVDFKELARERRFDNKNRRTLVDARIRESSDPSYKITPDDEPVCCSCHICAPCSWCVNNLTEDEE